MSAERVHRPPMDRTAPRRDFATILGQAASAASPDNPADRPTSARGADPISDGVRAAYQVIETYLLQGQRVAQQFGRFSYAPFSAAANTADLQARSVQLWTDLVANWFDLLGVLTETMRAPDRRSDRPGAEHPVESSTPSTQVPHVQLAYEVTSVRPACVYAQFHPGRETAELTSHGLRSLASNGCIDVGFDALPGGGPVVIKVEVPHQIEPGLYTGALLHAGDGSVVGSLTLQLR